MSSLLEQGLVSVLSGVGPAYPRLPQPPTFPAIRYQLIWNNRQTAVDGTQTGPLETGLQIDCIAASYSEAKTLADSVRVALNRYTGSWGSLKCLFCSLQSETDLSDQDGDKVTHWVAQRYQVWTNDS